MKKRMKGGIERRGEDLTNMILAQVLTRISDSKSWSLFGNGDDFSDTCKEKKKREVPKIIYVPLGNSRGIKRKLVLKEKRK